MTQSKSRINCTISEQVKAEFDYVQEQLNLSNQGEVIGLLLDAYRELQELKKQMTTSSDFNLSKEEEDLVNLAVNFSGMTRKQIAKRGFIAEAKTAISLAKRQADLAEANPEELKKMTFKGVAATRIEQIISRIMEHNDSQTEKQNKLCITESLVFKLTGSNRKALKDYFESHKLMIDDHNQKHSLTDADNRKGKGIDAKQMLNL